MDNKIYKLNSNEDASIVKDDSGIAYQSLKPGFGIVIDEAKSVTWEEYKKEFSVEQNLKNLEEFEVQLSSGTVEGEEFEVFMDRFKREHSWATT